MMDRSGLMAVEVKGSRGMERRHGVPFILDHGRKYVIPICRTFLQTNTA
jgi:hypothetical protein